MVLERDPLVGRYIHSFCLAANLTLCPSSNPILYRDIPHASVLTSPVTASSICLSESPAQQCLVSDHGAGMTLAAQQSAFTRRGPPGGGGGVC